MGRKYKHLYEQVCSFDNLWNASRKARCGKRQKHAVADFEYHLEENLLAIQQTLQTESYQFGGYNRFTIYEPHQRLISAAPYRDRVVHHALCNVIEPLLDRAMIYDSYACRVGKGTHSAIARAQHFLRSSSWVLKVDIKKYFFTIDHEFLLRDLEKKLTDLHIVNLIKDILRTYRTADEYYYRFAGDSFFDMGRPRGLPIGNLTSQLFANFYLTSFDRFVCERLLPVGYVRYMDDALVFGEGKSQMAEMKREIQEVLALKRLLLHPLKTQVFPSSQGVRFLGFHLYPHRRRILRPNIQRFKKRMRMKRMLYQKGLLEWDRLLLSLNSWLGFAGTSEHAEFVNEILRTISFEHPGSGIGFSFFVN